MGKEGIEPESYHWAQHRVPTAVDCPGVPNLHKAVIRLSMTRERKKKGGGGGE